LTGLAEKGTSDVTTVETRKRCHNAGLRRLAVQTPCRVFGHHVEVVQITDVLKEFAAIYLSSENETSVMITILTFFPTAQHP
jgi:hypothetical protein